MKKILFSAILFTINTNVFSTDDPIKYHLEPFTSFFISGSNYKAVAFEPGIAVRFDKNAIGMGMPILMNTKTELGNTVGAGLNGINVFYTYSPFSKFKKMNLSFTNDLLFEEFSNDHQFKEPSPVDPYYVEQSYKERERFVENYFELNFEYTISEKWTFYESTGVGCSYSYYTKKGVRYDEQRKQFEPAGILKIGFRYSL